MTRRDRRWRATGTALALVGCTGRLLDADGSALTALWMAAAVAGIVLALTGHRLFVLMRAERRHPAMAAALHARRRRRRFAAESPPEKHGLGRLNASHIDLMGDQG